MRQTGSWSEWCCATLMGSSARNCLPLLLAVHTAFQGWTQEMLQSNQQDHQAELEQLQGKLQGLLQELDVGYRKNNKTLVQLQQHSGDAGAGPRALGTAVLVSEGGGREPLGSSTLSKGAGGEQGRGPSGGSNPWMGSTGLIVGTWQGPSPWPGPPSTTAGHDLTSQPSCGTCRCCTMRSWARSRSTSR